MAGKKKDDASERFDIIYSQTKGMSKQFTILLDKETGVNYLYFESLESGGLTPLLDSEGKPVITPNGKELV